MYKNNCIFCQIAQKKAPAHVIWENDTHLSFLSIFPNTKAFTVVIPKQHYPSYAFENDQQTLNELMAATKATAQVLDNYFEDVSRCGMFFEGFGVDHLHSKLYPMHGTGDLENWSPIESETFDKYFKKYPGYLSSNNSARADDKQLADLAQKIKQSQKKA